MAEQRGPSRGPNSGKRNPGQSRGKGASHGRGGRGRDDRGGRGRGDRDDRGGRGRSDRDDRDDRGGRGRGDRDDRGGRGRSDRDDRGGRGRSDRDDRGGRGRGRGDRDDRGGRGRRGRDDRRDSEERRSGARGLRGDGRQAPPEAGPKSWGGLARRGAARLNEDLSEVEPELEPDGPFVPDEQEDPEAFAKYEARRQKRERGEANRERLRAEATAAIDRAGLPAKPVPKPPRKRKVPEPLERSMLAPRKLPDPKQQLKVLLGDSQGGRAWRDLNKAAEHLDEGRAGQARAITERLYRKAPDVVEVAELHGLALYGQGRWRHAIEVLEGVRELSGLPDQNPVLADAHRAIGNYADVEALWNELREASPAAAIVVEGRIVAAGALADQGRLQDAVRLLAKGWKRPKRPLEHHLRRAYSLADLYERAGEQPRAKELFGWIKHHESSYLDVQQRSGG